MNNLRAIKITYSDGNIICTSMAAHLTDSEMLNYFAIGKWFNIGSNADNMQQVVKTEILR
jgi:hypothetical protein